jgi:hypothetical protein
VHPRRGTPVGRDVPQLEDQINSPEFCAQLIMPVRGSFVNETLIKEQFLPGYLPTDLMKRTVRMVVRIRGIIEDFTTLKDFQNSPQQRAFAKILLENLTTCEQELPQLCIDLDKESATDRELPSS